MFHVLLDANQVVRGVSGAGPFADHDGLTQLETAAEPIPGQTYDPASQAFAFPPPLPPRVPARVDLYQARAVMRLIPNPKGGEGSLLDAVKALIAALTDPAQRAIAEEAIEYSNSMSRRGVFVTLLAPQLWPKGTDLEPVLDQLFRAADAIQA